MVLGDLNLEGQDLGEGDEDGGEGDEKEDRVCHGGRRGWPASVAVEHVVLANEKVSHGRWV